MADRYGLEEGRIRRAYRRYDSAPSEQAKRDQANAGNRAIERERDAWLGRLLHQVGVPTGNARAIEIGCGAGAVLRKLVALGADPRCLVGTDILEDRIESARALSPEIRFELTPVDQVPYADATFDLAIAFTLFSSILDPSLRKTVADEMTRVLKPGRPILWYDSRFPNPFNRDVTPVGRHELRRLFPGSRLRLRTVTLLPPLARRLGQATRVLYPALAVLPALRVRYIGTIWPRPAA